MTTENQEQTSNVQVMSASELGEARGRATMSASNWEADADLIAEDRKSEPPVSEESVSSALDAANRFDDGSSDLPPQTDEGSAPQGNDTPESSTQGEQTDASADEAQPKQDGLQKRINKLVRQREDAKREKDAALAELEQLKAQLQSQQSQPTQDPVAPREDDFDDYGKYMEALADYKADMKIKSYVENQNQQKVQQLEQTVQNSEQAFKQSRIEEASQKYQDFSEKVLQNNDLAITQAMSEAMFKSDNFAEIAYHLGSNPEVAYEIAQRVGNDPYAAAREIYSLESKVQNAVIPPPKPNVSGAPDPISPVKPTSPKKELDPYADVDKMSMDEWMEVMNERERQRLAKGRR